MKLHLNLAATKLQDQGTLINQMRIHVASKFRERFYTRHSISVTNNTLTLIVSVFFRSPNHHGVL